jgi:site-specific recombinase XerC
MHSKGFDMGKRKGAKYAAVQRLDALMASGVKRGVAKAEASARGESLFGFTDQRIHAFETRHNYQKIVMRFIDWCRDQHGVRDPAQIDEESDELASLYFIERIEAGYSAWTLQTERSALRMFFQNRELAKSVVFPRRKRENIVRSRYKAVRDAHFQPMNWQPLINFCLACGLRREELRDLRVRDVYVREGSGQLVVRVVKGKGGKWREVPVFPGREQFVQALVEGRDPDAHVFERLPSNMDIHSYRRRFAQELYEQLSGRPLPPSEGRLQAADFDEAAALQVSRCLGHNRVDIVWGHYVR